MRQRALPARIALLLVAVAAVVWLAAAYRGAHDEARAKALLDRGSPATLAPAERERALGLLHGARRGRPDGSAKQLEASLLTLTGDKPGAASLLRALVRREPENVTAWTLLAFADPREVARARERQRALAPSVR